MSSPSRTAQFAKVHKVLKKIYQPVTPNPERPVLEHLLFACCLENAHYDRAEEAYAALVHTFFDWNEIRVTSVKELAEVMSRLPDPASAARNLKKILQHVFESTYSFDLEEVRKKNLGPAIERLEKIDGATRFVRNYAIQSALGGHAIPLDAGALAVLRLLEMATDKDVAAGEVAGMERAVAKNKGLEFGSLLHHLSAEFTANPYLPALHKTLLQINPDIEAQLPKRRVKKVEPEPPPPPAKPAKGVPAAEGKATAAEAKPGSKAKPAPAAAPAEDDKSKSRKKKKDEPAAPPATPPAPAKPAVKPAPGKPTAAAKPSPAAPPQKPSAAKKTPPPLKKISPDDAAEGEGSARRASPAVGLSKKKPR